MKPSSPFSMSGGIGLNSSYNYSKNLQPSSRVNHSYPSSADDVDDTTSSSGDDHSVMIIKRPPPPTTQKVTPPSIGLQISTSPSTQKSPRIETPEQFSSPRHFSLQDDDARLKQRLQRYNVGFSNDSLDSNPSPRINQQDRSPRIEISTSTDSTKQSTQFPSKSPTKQSTKQSTELPSNSPTIGQPNKSHLDITEQLKAFTLQHGSVPNKTIIEKLLIEKQNQLLKKNIHQLYDTIQQLQDENENLRSASTHLKSTYTETRSEFLRLRRHYEAKVQQLTRKLSHTTDVEDRKRNMLTDLAKRCVKNGLSLSQYWGLREQLCALYEWGKFQDVNLPQRQVGQEDILQLGALGDRHDITSLRKRIKRDREWLEKVLETYKSNQKSFESLVKGREDATGEDENSNEKGENQNSKAIQVGQAYCIQDVKDPLELHFEIGNMTKQKYEEIENSQELKDLLGLDLEKPVEEFGYVKSYVERLSEEVVQAAPKEHHSIHHLESLHQTISPVVMNHHSNYKFIPRKIRENLSRVRKTLEEFRVDIEEQKLGFSNQFEDMTEQLTQLTGITFSNTKQSELKIKTTRRKDGQNASSQTPQSPRNEKNSPPTVSKFKIVNNSTQVTKEFDVQDIMSQDAKNFLPNINSAIHNLVNASDDEFRTTPRRRGSQSARELFVQDKIVVSPRITMTPRPITSLSRSLGRPRGPKFKKPKKRSTKRLCECEHHDNFKVGKSDFPSICHHCGHERQTRLISASDWFDDELNASTYRPRSAFPPSFAPRAKEFRSFVRKHVHAGL